MSQSIPSRASIAALTGGGEGSVPTHLGSTPGYSLPTAQRTQELVNTLTAAMNGQGQPPPVMSKQEAEQVAAQWGQGPFDNAFFMHSLGYTWDLATNSWLFTGLPQGEVAPSGGGGYFPGYSAITPDGTPGGGPTGRVDLSGVRNGSLMWRLATG